MTERDFSSGGTEFRICSQRNTPWYGGKFTVPGCESRAMAALRQYPGSWFQHRGIRDQGREDGASAPAHSLTKMKSTAENSLPEAAQSEAGLPNTLIKEENTRLSEAPSTPSLSTQIQYIHFHRTHSLTSGKEIPAQLRHFKDYFPIVPPNTFNVTASNFFIPNIS